MDEGCLTIVTEAMVYKSGRSRSYELKECLKRTLFKNQSMKKDKKYLATKYKINSVKKKMNRKCLKCHKLYINVISISEQNYNFHSNFQ